MDPSDSPDAPDRSAATRIVEAGYDRIAGRYLEWSGLRPSPVRLRWLGRAVDLIGPGSDVLELGCGAGLPMTAALADGRTVTGVDISAAQIELATRLVPGATFVHADMLEVRFEPSSFDAVAAFYSLPHVPRDEVPALLRRIAGWLRPGGVFVATMGADAAADEIEPDWLGVPMFFSHFAARRNRRLVAEAGLQVEESVVEDEPEDMNSARFLWIVARKPGMSGPATASRPPATSTSRITMSALDSLSGHAESARGRARSSRSGY